MDWSNELRIAISLCVFLWGLIAPFAAVLAHRRFTNIQLQSGHNLALIAVRAAEQLSGTNAWTNAQKYNAAANFLDSLATRAGLHLDEEQVKPLIEGAVHVLNTFEAPSQALASSIGDASTTGPTSADIEGMIQTALQQFFLGRFNAPKAPGPVVVEPVPPAVLTPTP